MHTFIVKYLEPTPRYDPTKGIFTCYDRTFTVHHNSDFSGMVTISGMGRVDNQEHVPITCDIPFEVLAQIVGAKMRQDQIATLEQADGLSVLKAAGLIWEQK